MPSLLPDKLYFYQKTETPQELLHLLSQNPADFVTFMLVCFEDETWCNAHQTFTRGALHWLSEKTFTNQLSPSETKTIAKSIQDHAPSLIHLLPMNLLCELDEGKIALNNLLFQAAAPFWQHLIRTNCYEKKSRTFPLSNVPRSEFQILTEFIYTGEVKELWRLKQSEIHKIFQLSHSFELISLKEECEQLLLRYITHENLFEFLSFANRYSLKQIKSRCCDLLNEIRSGIQFKAEGEQDLICELTEATESTLELFSKLIAYITRFIASNNVLDNTTATHLLKKCPKLFSIDIGHTRSFNENITPLHGFKELILSGCGWLHDQHLKKYIASFSQLQKLNLTSCPAITFTGWGELTKLPNLVSLTLDRCYGLTNEELELILLSTRGLRELTLSECRNLTDPGFHALSTSHQQFVSLDLSRTALLDRNLLEITSRLSSLNYLRLTRCQNLSEQGIIDGLKIAPSLEEVNLTHTNISENALRELMKFRPSLKIILD